VLANSDELAGDYLITPIEVPDDLDVTHWPIESLPAKWDASQPTEQTRELGTAWARPLETAVLVVPSAVIARESNYLLNPNHPDFVNIRFLSPEPFYFDDRLRSVWLKK
jgi:RES domain-containing protein